MITEIIKFLIINFYLEGFILELDKLGSLAINVEIFQNAWINVLDKYVLENQKYVRANQGNFMNTELNHVIMVASKLPQNYLKSRINKV